MRDNIDLAQQVSKLKTQLSCQRAANDSATVASPSVVSAF